MCGCVTVTGGGPQGFPGVLLELRRRHAKMRAAHKAAAAAGCFFLSITDSVSALLVR